MSPLKLFVCTFVLSERINWLHAVIKHSTDVLNWIFECATRVRNTQMADSSNTPLSGGPIS